MSEPSLTEEAVARLAVALKGLRENREKSLEELIDPACRFLLRCREGAQVHENNYRREQFEKRFESKQAISEAEIARLVAGDRHKKRAVERFREFVCYIMDPDNELIRPPQNLAFLDQYLERREWTQGWVDYLRKVFPEYQRFKRATSQPKTKKKKKVLALI
jgi:hypothetical protein